MRGLFLLPCDLSWPPPGPSDQNFRNGWHMLWGYLVNDGASLDRIYHPAHWKLWIKV